MATITVPSDSTLPVAGAEIKAAPLKDWITNIRTFLEATNIDEANVDTSASDGIVGMSIAQTITGLKTFSTTSAAAGGLREVAKFEINPSSGTPANNDGLRLTFTADDAGGAATAIGYVDLKMTDASASSEDSEWRFSTIANASSVTPLVVNSTAITMTTTTVAIGTNATIGGGLTVTGTGIFGALTVGDAAISEAELEMLDGITAGTVAASKAVVVDSSLDIASFRNVTLTGELDAATLDISGNADIDGTTNLDAVDIDGAVQIDSTVSVGVNDQGYDVKFFGDTASAYLLWDTSADKLLTSGGAAIDVVKDKLLIGGTAVTTTAAELNILDGATVTTTELNLIDGGTSRGTTAVASGDGLLVNDAGTMSMTNVDTVSTYFAGHSVGGTNIVTVGTVGTGTWQGTKVASAYLDDDTAHLAVVQTFTANKTFTGTVTVGVDGTGKDVIFYGDTPSSSLTWDESADDLVFANAGIAINGSTDATGDVYYRDASGFLARLGVGSDGDVLTSTGTLPNWETPTTGDISGVTAGVGLSGGGTSGTVTLTLDLSELSTVTPADGDFFSTLDSDGSNEQKTTTTALATLFAGAGMTATSAVLNVIGGDGITANANDVAITAAQTTVTSVYNTSLKMGRDSQNLIDFATTDNKIILRVNNVDEVELVADVLQPTTSDGVALGTASLMWSDLFLASGSVINFAAGDVTLTHSSNTLTMAGGTLAASAITLGGTALGSLYSPIAGSSSIATVGTVTAGTWQSSTVVASAYLDAQTAHLNVTQSFTGAKTFGAASQFNSTVTVGVNDAGYDVKFFGAADGAYMEWDNSADQLRILGPATDAAASSGKLLLATAQTSVESGDILGQIDFQAPLETGTDAIVVSASVKAVAQGTFAANVNATDLIFYTAHDAAVAERFRMTSQGEIGIAGANYGTDGQVLTSAGAGAAAAWESVSAGVSLSGSTDDTIATVTGSNALQGEANLTFNSSNVLTVTGTADVSGDFTAGTVNADADTAAGDNAVMGYTTAEGLILTGQGSLSDVTIKNDADATVLSIPTGTTKVGIGTTASQCPLHIHGAYLDPNTQINSSGAFFTSSTALAANKGGVLQFGGIYNSGGDITQFSTIQGLKENATDGDADGYLSFITRGSDIAERMRITSAGDVTVSTGNLVMGTSGKGISFAATGDGPSMSSELLDDYEEGLASAVAIRYGGHAGTAYDTTGTRFEYTKIGRVVYYNFQFTVTNPSVSNDAAVQVAITGLPFTASNNPDYNRATMSIQFWNKAASTPMPYVLSNTTRLDGLQNFNTGGSYDSMYSDSFYRSSGNNAVIVTGFYHTDS